MPPRFLRRRYPTRLKPCQERRVAVCDTTTADGCCGVVPCIICFEWEADYDIDYGSAVLSDSSWVGTISERSIVAYWQVNYETAECEFVVEFMGEEVSRQTCYTGASCRNPSGEVSVTLDDYTTGILRWSVHEPRELKTFVNPETGCTEHFCGSCRCTCRCLCITVLRYGGGIDTGELCDSSYECDPPSWSGSVGYHSFSFSLSRGEYGECLFGGTIDGIPIVSVEIGDCSSLSASFTLANGDVIEVSCKQCGCEEEDQTVCCESRCNPYVSPAHPGDCLGITGENPLPRTLTVEMWSDSPYGCWSGSTEVTLVSNGRWGLGRITAICNFCCPSNSANTCVWLFNYDIFVNCGVEGWIVEVRLASSYDGSLGPVDANLTVSPLDVSMRKASCYPILLSGEKCFNPAMTCAGLMPPIGSGLVVTHPTMCLSFLVSETL